MNYRESRKVYWDALNEDERNELLLHTMQLQSDFMNEYSGKWG